MCRINLDSSTVILLLLQLVLGFVAALQPVSVAQRSGVDLLGSLLASRHQTPPLVPRPLHDEGGLVGRGQIRLILRETAGETVSSAAAGPSLLEKFQLGGGERFFALAAE